MATWQLEKQGRRVEMRAEGQRRYNQAMGEQTLAELIDAEIVVQTEARAVRWEMADLVARDGHVVRVGFAARVRALPAEVERRMLREALMGGRSTLSAADVRHYFQATLRSAAMPAVAMVDAATLLSGDERPRVEAALVQAARAIAFSSGIEILPPFELTIDSPTLAVQRLGALQRQQIEQRVQHRRAVEEAMATGRPIVSDDLSPQAYVDHMAAAMDLAAARAPRATLVAASGQGLAMVEIDNGRVAPLRLVPLPADLGPLRSVRPGVEGRLLVGAQRGVMLVAPYAQDDVAILIDPALAAETGFNDITQWRGGVWATHAEGGLIAWDEHQPAEPAQVWRTADLRSQLDLPDATPRHLQALDEDRLAFAMGSTLCTIDAERKFHAHPLASAEILHLSVHLTPQGQRLLVLRTDGSGETRDAHTPEVLERWPVGGSITAAGAQPCLDQQLMLTAGEDGTITARALHAQTPRMIRQFLSTSRTPRKLIATARYIAALAPDRQRVVLWQTTVSEPLLTLHLTPQTRHRVADVCWLEG